MVLSLAGRRATAGSLARFFFVRQLCWAPDAGCSAVAADAGLTRASPRPS